MEIEVLDSDRNNIYVEKLPKNMDYKLGPKNNFKASTNFKWPEASIDFKKLLEDHFESNGRKFEDLPIICREAGGMKGNI